jgi:predicted lipoprotein with Yx(FWY)xxD motif
MREKVGAEARRGVTMRGLLSATVLLAALAVAGCGGDDGNDDGGSDGARAGYGSAAPAATVEQDAGGTEIKVADSDYGPILFDGSEQAIYLFEKEEGSRSRCYGACAEAWPPVLTEGEPIAGPGAEGSLLGTTERTDGTTQVTYAGHPLYYYVDDPKGEVLCQNVEEFGGLWLVVAPDGKAVR